MHDAYTFLQQWFQLYPEYQNNNFYVTGESYGGHYVPQLSWTILQGNKNATTKINLKGLLVGNPYTDDNIDSWSIPPFIFYHHLCSLPTWMAILANCGNSTSHETSPIHPLTLTTSMPFSDRYPRRLRGVTDACDNAMNTMYTEVGSDINQYDIYYPCLVGDGLDCSNYTAEIDYLNNPAVQAAIHAKKPVQPWAVCSNVNYGSSWASVISLYPELMENIHVTVYAGDVTFNVPALGTQVWVEGLKQKTVSAYQAWYVDGQVAGYFKKFSGITYVTVKDSGHMVPTFTPVQAKALLDNYLSSTF
jgi:serine carboxypeptidase-like clade 2